MRSPLCLDQLAPDGVRVNQTVLSMIVLGPIMMEKISQRTQDDCAICVIAMVMGPPYTYERVFRDSKKYPRTDNEGHGLAWWKDYLNDEGFRAEHRPFRAEGHFPSWLHFLMIVELCWSFKYLI